MSAVEHVAVVVPAADEQDTIVGCLDAIAGAARVLRAHRRDITLDVVVVLDRCRDRTAERVAAVPGVFALPVDERCVGATRDAGSRVALERAPCRAGRVWTAHTDADSLVGPDWLLGHVQRAEAGADVVLGTVEPSPDEPLLSRWRGQHSSADGHPHVHGANLGVRGSVLLALGGWPRVCTGEDADLVDAAVAAGANVARVGGLVVTTSARRVARAPRGFSSYLRDLDRQTDRAKA